MICCLHGQQFLWVKLAKHQSERIGLLMEEGSPRRRSSASSMACESAVTVIPYKSAPVYPQLALQETAINIGFACNLLRNDMRQYIITANLPEVLALDEAGKVAEAYSLAHSRVQQQLQEAESHIISMAHEDGDNALIIDGKALAHGLAADLCALLLSVSVRRPPFSAPGTSLSYMTFDCRDVEASQH